MQITIDTNAPQIKTAIAECAKQVPFAISVAINKTMDQAKGEIATEMPRALDRPTPWIVNSLRTVRSTKTNLAAFIGFKDLGNASNPETDVWRSMLQPNVNTGTRHFKGFEAQLLNLGFMPAGYNAVPGKGATLDSYGNMSRAQVNQIMTALSTWSPNGKKTKGTGKGNAYVGSYWVNRVEGRFNYALLPGVYQTVKTGFGIGVRPMLIFVKRAQYKRRLDFFGMTQKVIDRDFIENFGVAFDEAMRTALP